MCKAIHTLLMSERKASNANWSSIAALIVLVVGGLLPHPASAQPSAQAPTPTRGKPSLPPYILAMHARAKRPVPAVPTSLEDATTAALAPTTFNSDQGHGPGAIGPGPGCNLFP